MTEKGKRRYIHTTLCSCPCGYVATNANERTAFTQMKIHKKVCKINCSGDNMTSIVDYSCKGLNFEKIKKELLSNPYVLASAPSFGNNGRMYFYKDNVLRTRLMNENRKKSLEETEMIVIDLNEASNISGIYGDI